MGWGTSLVIQQHYHIGHSKVPEKKDGAQDNQEQITLNHTHWPYF